MHNELVARDWYTADRSQQAPIERIGPPNLVYSSRYGSLYDDFVTGPAGQPGTYLRWAWTGAGVIVVPTDGQRLYLWPMYRYPISAQSLEFPRGAVEADESVTDAAARELVEETGFTAVTTEVLGRAHADTGLIASNNVVVLAKIDTIRPGQSRLEPTEAIAGPAVPLTVAEIGNRIRSSDITCALTIAAFVHALPHVGDET
jgi:ADP-ribose pyrophosphatase